MAIVVYVSVDTDHFFPDSQAFDDCDTFTFRVKGSGDFTSTRSPDVRIIDLPSREDTLELFAIYVNSSDSQVPNILHPSSVQYTIADVYSHLQQAHKISLGSAGLILTLCAAGALLWEEGISSRFNLLSEDNAITQCILWRNAAWDLLDQTQRAASHSLEAIQARLVIADILYNMEGTTSRYRYVQACARAAAYELRLHTIDLPGNISADTPFLREMKRRIWWHIASNDWYVDASWP